MGPVQLRNDSDLELWLGVLSSGMGDTTIHRASFVATRLKNPWLLRFIWILSVSEPPRKAVFGGLRPGKTQTALINYRD